MNITSLAEYRLQIETEVNQIQQILKSKGIKNKNTARQIQEVFRPEELTTSDGVYIPFLFCHLDLKEIDAEALANGADADGLYRTSSFLIYTARRHNEAGHTRIRLEELKTATRRAEKRIADTEAITAERIEEALFFITKKTRTAVIEDDYFQFVTLKNAEENITNDINEILKNTIENKITEEDLVSDIELDESQKEACLAINYPLSIITGGPGTGKSTILKTICDTWEQHNGGKIVLMAPTGKASQRMREATGRDAQTIHRTLEIQPYKTAIQSPVQDNCLLIIDECSMVDTYLFAILTEQMLKAQSTILIGDMEQLQSVGPGAVFRDLLECKRIKTFELKTVHRQNENSMIYKNAQNVVHTKKMIGFYEDEDFTYDMDCITDNCLVRIRDLYMKESATGQDVRIFVPIRDEKYRTGTAQINMMMHYALKEANESEYLSAHRKADDGTVYPTRVYSRGDPIIWTRNDYDLNFLNGDMGVVLEATEEELTVRINGETVTLNNKRQISECLDLAYAMSVHKAQGSTCDIAIVFLPADSEDYVEKSLLYVAITRPRSCCHLIAEGESVQKAIFKMTDRQTGLRDKLKRKEEEIWKVLTN